MDTCQLDDGESLRASLQAHGSPWPACAAMCALSASEQPLPRSRPRQRLDAARRRLRTDVSLLDLRAGLMVGQEVLQCVEMQRSAVKRNCLATDTKLSKNHFGCGF